MDPTGSSQVDLDVIEATINKELDEEQGGITGYSNQDDLKDVKALQYPDNTAITICSYFLASTQSNPSLGHQYHSDLDHQHSTSQMTNTEGFNQEIGDG